jgi:hypothetical protein
MNVFYKRRGWVVERVVVVVGSVGSYKSGIMRVVMDVEYCCIVVEGVIEVVVITCVSYGVTPCGAADTHCCFGVCSVLCDPCARRRMRCEDSLL